jgi:threonine aldolase
MMRRMPEITREQRLAAMRGCARQVSGVRSVTVADRLRVLADRVDAAEMPDMYGAGGAVGALEGRVAELLGTDGAVFFPTGTMAQQVALRYGAELTGRRAVALHPLSHPMMHERHAYSVLSGLHAVAPTAERRNATADEIAALAELVGTVMLELPLRDAGYVLPTWGELVAAVAAARGARVHLDGARLWESTVYLGHSLAEVAALADSTYVSFYKSLGGISGAALAGDAALVEYARVWRHRYGGTVFQQWPAALAALYGLDTVLPRLMMFVAHARVVAGVLAELPGARVHPDPPHTHQFQLWLPYPADRLEAAAVALAESDRTWFAGGWRDGEAPGTAMAEVTVAGPACELDAGEIGEIGRRYLELVSGARAGGCSVRSRDATAKSEAGHVRRDAGRNGDDRRARR